MPGAAELLACVDRYVERLEISIAEQLDLLSDREKEEKAKMIQITQLLRDNATNFGLIDNESQANSSEQRNASNNSEKTFEKEEPGDFYYGLDDDDDDLNEVFEWDMVNLFSIMMGMNAKQNATPNDQKPQPQDTGNMFDK